MRARCARVWRRWHEREHRLRERQGSEISAPGRGGSGWRRMTGCRWRPKPDPVHPLSPVHPSRGSAAKRACWHRRGLRIRSSPYLLLHSPTFGPPLGVDPSARRRAVCLFDSILSLRLRDALPLHVLGRIGAAALQRHDVVNRVSRARADRRPSCRARMQLLEGMPCARTAPNPAAGRPLARNAVVRAVPCARGGVQGAIHVGRWVRRERGRPWSRGSLRAYRCETLAGATAATSRASVPIRNRSEDIARTRCTRQASRTRRFRGQLPATVGRRPSGCRSQTRRSDQFPSAQGSA